VHNPQHNAWFDASARDAAHAFGVDVVAQEAEDLKTALRFYQDAFAGADAKRDVVWLPQDSTTVDETTVLPYVLQEA